MKETAKKGQSVIYVPEQCITLIEMVKTTGKIYHITEMSQADFFNFKKLTEYECWKTDTKNKPFKKSEYKSFGKNLKRRSKSLPGLQKLYGNEFPIDDKKLKGIVWLCNTGKIPTMYHNFYKSLKSRKTASEDIEDLETDLEDEEDSE
ncbi:hypothetical protein ILUMI_17863 [Ignelater luminosus]|uniref:Uncharacterized protein n=1 Tax=Ignelater luminosus TaxID=2038154 RepID=A0A8K0CNQ7_IGNLU|nr:hypothetical protein ILUMI_17863 [Ignelater luminosus]